MSMLTGALARQAAEIVRQAGKLLTEPDAVQTIIPKSRTDFVTNVDLFVQERIRGRLNRLAPDVQFLGEEGEKAAIDPGRPFWILDPVDGTTNLIHRFGHSAVSLALAEHGQVCFGVVHQPYTEECFPAFRPFRFLYCCVLMPDQTRVISSVKIAYSAPARWSAPGQWSPQCVPGLLEPARV